MEDVNIRSAMFLNFKVIPQIFVVHIPLIKADFDEKERIQQKSE